MNVVLASLKMAGLNTAFMQAAENFSGNWQGAMTFVPSSYSTEDYGWLGDVAQMEEWKSELVPHGLAEFDYSLKNKKFGSAIKIDDDELADERYGQTLIRISDLAEKAKAYPAVLLRNLRANGTTALCYDGQPFFSTTHQEGESQVQSNLVAGTGNTEAQVQADFSTGRGLMYSYETDKGDVVVRENAQFVVVCGPSMEIPIRKGLMQATVSTGGQNVFYGMVKDVEVDPGITDNDWYIEDRAPRLKAYILQEREGVTPANTLPGSDTHVLEDATVYRAKWRGNAGYAQWKHAVKINNA